MCARTTVNESASATAFAASSGEKSAWISSRFGGFDVRLLSTLNGTEREPADDVPLERKREYDDRHDRDHGQRADLAPLNLVPADEVGERDRQRPHLRPGEEKREQELVPREHEGEERAGDDSGHGEPQRDARERAPARRAVHHRGLLEIARQVVEEALHE